MNMKEKMEMNKTIQEMMAEKAKARAIAMEPFAHSQILIKKIFEDEFVEWGKVFCLDTRNGAVIKRIYPTGNQEVIECRSINPDYPPFKVNVRSINGWYRVLMVLSMK